MVGTCIASGRLNDTAYSGAYVTPLSRATEWDEVKPLITLLLISVMKISGIYLTPAVIY